MHEKPYIQVAEVFAALAEMQAGKGPGGTRGTAEMRQNFPVQLKLKVTLHLDRYLERLTRISRTRGDRRSW